MDLEAIVAAGVHKGVGDRHGDGMPLAQIIRAVTKELRENADVVRMEMEHQVWGMVK